MKIQTGKITRPQKVVIYGPEGVGKTTLAASFPAPVFIDTERGTHHLDVARFDQVAAWEDIAKAVADLATQQHDFKTLVIDTADWAEKRLVEHVCKKNRKDSIEDFGYGKGYVVLAEEFAKFFASLDKLIGCGINVVLLAHAIVRKFEDPEQQGAFDRYELKLSKHIAPQAKEWADMLLFANYETRVVETDKGKTRAYGGKERVIYTTHTAAYDAKNRHNLPDKMLCSFDSIAHLFGGNATPKNQEQKPTMLDSIHPMENLLAGKTKAQKEKVLAGAIERKWLVEGQTLADMPEKVVKGAFAEPERFFSLFGI